MHRKLLLLLCCLSSAPALAATYLDHGEHRIHFTTFSSYDHPPGCRQRSWHRTFREEGRSEPIGTESRVHRLPPPYQGMSSTCLNQRFELVFDEVNEAEAIYYLASYLALEHDILRFHLDVRLNTTESVPINFVRRYD